MTGPGPGSSTVDRALRERTAAARELRQRLGEVRGQGESAGGLVRVEVAVGGRVTKLTLDPRAIRLGTEGIAEQIMAALDVAAADAARQVAEHVAAATPGGASIPPAP